VTAATALLRVLLVEDDLGDVALMESSFAELQVPAELHHVVDGAEALAFLHHEAGYADAPRPDLILLDLNMPRVDGRQVLAEIKADEQLKAIPVVVFTTSANPNARKISVGPGRRVVCLPGSSGSVRLDDRAAWRAVDVKKLL